MFTIYLFVYSFSFCLNLIFYCCVSFRIEKENAIRERNEAKKQLKNQIHNVTGQLQKLQTYLASIKRNMY